MHVPQPRDHELAPALDQPRSRRRRLLVDADDPVAFDNNRHVRRRAALVGIDDRDMRDRDWLKTDRLTEDWWLETADYSRHRRKRELLHALSKSAATPCPPPT